MSEPIPIETFLERAGEGRLAELGDHPVVDFSHLDTTGHEDRSGPYWKAMDALLELMIDSHETLPPLLSVRLPGGRVTSFWDRHGSVIPKRRYERRTYEVSWERGVEPGVRHSCSGLTPALVVRRIRNLLAAGAGGVKILELKPDAESLVVSEGG